MGHKKQTAHASLTFPSGRVKHVPASRRELAKKLCAIAANGWYRLAKPLGPDAGAWERLRSIEATKIEASAAKALERLGMVERFEHDATCVRWSILHERPTFGRDYEAHEVYGHRITCISSEQKELITQVMMAGARRMRHEVLTLNAPKLRRTIEALERRGILTVSKRESVWSLGLGEKYQTPAGKVGAV